MPCPEKISTLFELARLDGENPSGTALTLLNHVFPVEEDYVVVPQYQDPSTLSWSTLPLFSSLGARDTLSCF